ALVFAVPRASGAGDGVLDTTFAGGSGVERVPYYGFGPRYTSNATSTAVQNDGKILVGFNLNGFGNCYVERVLADGSGVDTSIQGNGVFLLPTYSAVGQPRIKLDAGQNIVVGGQCPDTGQGGHPCLWRMTPAGSGDSSFGNGGWVELPVQMSNGYVYSKVVDFDFGGDGSIYALAGAFYNQLPYANTILGVLFKLDSGGNIVGASNGAAINAPSGTTVGNLRRIAFKDGKLTLGGTVAISNSEAGYDIVVMRFDSNGSIDNGFGNSGVATFGFDIGGQNQDDLAAMLIQPDGKILLGGTATDGAQTPQLQMGLARMRADGSGLDSGDPGFGTPFGKFTFTAYYDGNTGDRSQDTLTDLALQSDLKIVVVGWSDKSNVPGANPNADNVSSAVFRFDPYGVDDANFSAGAHNLALGFMSDSTRVDHTLAVGLQSGRIILGGYAGAGVDANDTDVVIARLQGDLIFTNGFDLGPAPLPF
ncbi:MAG TPA: hypothetical protein VFI49_15250, partial [Rudaea sp.]|nr:hypothetical protein [Rudaea sp.]